VSVVIPARDEAAAIRGVVSGVRSVLGPDAEVIVVDHGSTDGTAAEATAAGAQAVTLSRHGGKGTALRSGFARARGRLVVTMDGDGQDDPRDIPRLLDAAQEADVVIGSRFLGTFEPGAISPVNKVATRAFDAAIRLLFGGRMTDSQAGMRCFRTDALARIVVESEEFEVETEMLVKALAAGLRVASVPVTRRPRSSGATSFRRVRHGLRIAFTIVRVRLATLALKRAPR
jgi:glycosyltransferase involved in cell wall biosynthesis